MVVKFITGALEVPVKLLCEKFFIIRSITKSEIEAIYENN